MVSETTIQVVEDMRSKSRPGTSCIRDVSGQIVCVPVLIPKIYCHFSEDWREKKIKDVDEDFRHPWRVVDFLKDELHSSCIGYSHTGEHCEDDCERRLSWWPILTCKQAHWQIFEFRKEV